jgi:hypothetical protein
MKRFLTIILEVLLATVFPIRPQSITGSISGAVLDASERAVANAKVIAVEQGRHD